MELREKTVFAKQVCKMMVKLLVQITPFPDESILGFIHRLAEINGLSGVFLANQFKICKTDTIEQFTLYIASNPFWRDSAKELFSPSTRPMPLWNFRHRRFCFQCLFESRYWRAEWDLSLVTACVHHKIKLRDTCQHCQATLLWNMHLIDRCPNCNQSLSLHNEDVPIASSDNLWLSKELIQRLKNSPQYLSKHALHLGLTNFHDLAFRLGACASRPNGHKPLKIAHSGNITVADPIATAAGQLLNNWPTGFFKTLDRIKNERNSISQWKIKSVFGQIYDEVFDELVDDSFSFIREGFEKYLQKNWHAPLCYRHRNLSAATIHNHHWLPIEEISKRVDIDRSLIARLSETGEIACKSVTYPSGRVGRAIDAAELISNIDDLRKAISVNDASKLLGLTKDRVKQLIDLHLLKIYGGEPKPGERWWISFKSIDSLMDFAVDLPVIDNLEKNQISFNYLLRYLVYDASSFKNLINAAFSNAVKIIGRSNDAYRICDWVVDRNQAMQMLNNSRSQNLNFFTIPEIADILDIKQEVAYSLVNLMIIKSSTKLQQKKSIRLVSKQDLDHFQQNYIFGSKLSKAIKRSPKWLVTYLREHDVHPVVGPTIIGKQCRQYCWRRTKILENFIEAHGNSDS